MGKWHVVNKLKEMGKEGIDCIVVPPKEPVRLFDRGTSQGRTIFDHGWVEDYYMHGIECASREIDCFQKDSSGWGEPHRETRRKALEISKWQL